MRITPELIETKEFKVSMRGYNKKEIDIFLDEIIDEFETLLKEKQKLREEKDILLNQLNHFKKIENELNETLLKAQESAEEIIDQAKKDYDKKLQEINLLSNDSDYGTNNNDDDIVKFKNKSLELKKTITNILEKYIEDLNNENINVK